MRRNIELFNEAYPGSRGIPGLGHAPAMPVVQAALAGLLARERPNFGDPDLRKQMRDLRFGGLSRIDAEGQYHSPNVADAVASAYFTPMTNIVANLGGAVQQLPQAWQFGGKQRTFGGGLTLNSQASGTTFGVCRVPLFGAIVGITLVTSISLGTATLAIGDANAAAQYVAAATYTAVDTPTRIGKAAQHLTQLLQGYDAVSGKATNYAAAQNDPQSAAPESQGFGGLYEDITMVTAVAALPASGTLVILVDYVLD